VSGIFIFLTFPQLFVKDLVSFPDFPDQSASLFSLLSTSRNPEQESMVLLSCHVSG